MKFTLRVVYKPIRPVDTKTIAPNASVAELRSIEDWEIQDGAEWIPYGISGNYLEFMVPTNKPM